MLSLPAQQQKRLNRWRLQSIARDVLKNHRVAKCYRMRIKKFVDINYATESKRAFYGGLCVCGSVWVCPVCSNKITERRKNELLSVDWSSYVMFIVTVTISHKKTDSLKSLTDALKSAWRVSLSGRWYQTFKKDFSIVGSWSGLEVTYGVGSGWHPHKHILFVSKDKNIDVDKIKNVLSVRYISELKKRDKFASFEHGIKVQNVSAGNVDYVGKFVKELTKSNHKTGRGFDRLHPFELLDGDIFLQKRFIEYVQVFEGFKQLTPSPGLRKVLGLGVELSDSELAESDIDLKYFLLARLDADDWKQISKKDMRGELLEVASYKDVELLSDFVESVGCKKISILEA